jgi:hypothetical protein
MENIEEPVTVVLTNEKKSNTNDPRILRARGGDFNNPDPSKRPTDPVGLSRSILHVLKDYEYVCDEEYRKTDDYQRYLEMFRVEEWEVEE